MCRNVDTEHRTMGCAGPAVQSQVQAREIPNHAGRQEQCLCGTEQNLFYINVGVFCPPNDFFTAKLQMAFWAEQGRNSAGIWPWIFQIVIE